MKPDVVGWVESHEGAETEGSQKRNEIQATGY